MCKLKIKEGKAEIRTSPFLSKRIHLGRISESQYTFYADFFPDAFEIEECDACKVQPEESSEEKKTETKKKKK